MIMGTGKHVASDIKGSQFRRPCVDDYRHVIYIEWHVCIRIIFSVKDCINTLS